MFDFFDEIQEFLSQAVTNYNNFSAFVSDAVVNFADVLDWIQRFSEAMPAPFSWIMPLVMIFAVFEFARGRG
ncbi:MAG: hypothetical protein IJ642_06045 [Oscillospiraceae bacterium]|nr:hypothetical protein [Oscillospiraceae bacterium]MBR1528843.1 hypothetical protein [Oscillospiraceae bacterium]